MILLGDFEVYEIWRAFILWKDLKVNGLSARKKRTFFTIAIMPMDPDLWKRKVSVDVILQPVKRYNLAFGYTESFLHNFNTFF